MQKYNSANQQLTFGSYNILYDANGNMTNIVSGTTTNTLGWNARNQLTNMVVAGSFKNFSYDGLGRRMTRPAGPISTRFTYDGLDILRQPGGFAPTYNYFRGLAIDEPWAQTRTTFASPVTTNTFTYLADALGSVVAMTDSNKNIVTEYDYEPFGATTTTGLSLTNAYKFTAREDDGTGLYYYRARYYHPGLGRFVSEDPIEYWGNDINLYAYVYNDPSDFQDPAGLYTGVDDAVFIAGGVLAGVGGQAMSDLFRGEVSSWQDYLGSAIGGALGGEALLYVGPVAAGVIGGGGTNIAKQWLKISYGDQYMFDVESLAIDSAVGGILGTIPGSEIPGVTIGGNSHNAIYKQMVTKFETGQISTVTADTALKMFVGRAQDTALPQAAIGAAAYDASHRSQ